MADCNGLGDHPSHRRATDMRFTNIKGVQKTYCIIGHILQGVGCALFPSYERPEVWYPCLIEFRGKTRIPAIEPDDIMTPFREVSAKFIVPMNQLVGKSSNQKEGLGRRVPKRFVLDVYPVGCCFRHVDPLSTTYVSLKKT